MKKIITLTATLLLLSTVLFAQNGDQGKSGTNQPQTQTTQQNNQTQQNQQNQQNNQISGQQRDNYEISGVKVKTNRAGETELTNKNNYAVTVTYQDQNNRENQIRLEGKGNRNDSTHVSGRIRVVSCERINEGADNRPRQ